MNMTVAAKLGTGFGLVVTLFIMAFILVGTRIDQVRQGTEQIQKETLPFLMAGEDLVYQVVQVQQYLTDVALTRNQEGFNEAEQSARRFMDNAAKFKTMYRQENDPDSLKQIEAIETAFQQYYAIGKRMFGVYVNNGLDAGNVEMVKFDQAAQTLNSLLEPFHAQQRSEGDVISTDNVSLVYATQRIMNVSAFAVAVIAGLIAFFITRNLRRQLGGEPDLVAGLAKKIAQGDLSTQIELKSGDTDSVMAAMKNMMLAIQALVNDVDQLSDAAVEGRLSTRADAGKHQGDYRNIVEGVNQTLDSLVGYLDSMPIAAMIIDKEFNIRYMNKLGAKLGNTTQESLCGQKCFGYFKTEDCSTSKCACDQAMRSGSVIDAQTLAHPGQLELDINYIGT
ncbi:MAG: PAS domain-containing protein, partial [Gammaproteobacteria bacterium]